MEEKKLNNDEIDLFEIFQTLYKQKALILTITAVFTLVSFIVSIVMPKTYVAQGGCQLFSSEMVYMTIKEASHI